MRALHIGLIAALVFSGSTSFAQQRPLASAPADLAVVINILKDPAATDAQRQKLVGKIYAGQGTVVAVHISADDPSVAFIDVDQTAEPALGATVVHLRFQGRTADAKVQNLARDQVVHVRGTLKSFSITDRVKLALFGDLVIQ